MLARKSTLALRPDADIVPRAVQWLEEIALREDWPTRTTFALTLCLDEALTNVVSYAFDSGAVRPAVRLTCRVDERTIELELRDNGRPYDPTVSTPRALAACLNDADFGGHGLRLMRHYLHDLAYRRDANWNCLNMCMHLDRRNF